MSISHLLDHTATVWRRQRTTDAHGIVTTGYLLVGTHQVGVRRPRDPITDTGPGLAPAGERVIYADADEDIRALDVVSLVAGPDMGTTVEVDGQPTRPRGHHLEARCRIWHGVLS